MVEGSLFRHLILLQVFLVIFFALSDTGWAQAPLEQPTHLALLPLNQLIMSGPFISESEFGRPRANPVKSSLLLSLSQDPFTLKTSLVEKHSNGQGFNDLSAAAGRQKLLQTLATAALLEGILVTEGEVAYSSFDPKSLGGVGKPQNRLLRFGVKGAWKDLGYGAEYRSVGKGFTNLAGPQVATNQEGGELWVQQKFGALSLRGSLSEISDNLEKDPTSPRFTKTQGGATMSLALPSWPLLSLFYHRAFSSSSDEPTDLRPRKGSVETAGASLYYAASGWAATLSSTYAQADDRSRASRQESLSLSSLATGSYFPAFRAQTQTPVVSMGLTYRPLAGTVTIGAGGSYTKARSDDGLTNTSTLNTSTSVVWKLATSPIGAETLSIEAVQTRYLDSVYSGNSHKDLSVRFMLKFAPF